MQTFNNNNNENYPGAESHIIDIYLDQEIEINDNAESDADRHNEETFGSISAATITVQDSIFVFEDYLPNTPQEFDYDYDYDDSVVMTIDELNVDTNDNDNNTKTNNNNLYLNQ